MNPVARKNDRLTSVTAGESVATKTTAKQDVYTILRGHGPMHDDAIREWHEAYAASGKVARKSPQRLRTARAELVEAGLVVEHRVDGKQAHARMPSGYNSTIWKVNIDG